MYTFYVSIMRILILGGTGAMGKPLVEILSRSLPNSQIIVTSRSARESRSNITYIMGDAHNNIFLKDILKDKWDVIVDFMVYNTQCFADRVDLLLCSTSQYIFLSSSRVYANSIILPRL